MGKEGTPRAALTPRSGPPDRHSAEMSVLGGPQGPQPQDPKICPHPDLQDNPWGVLGLDGGTGVLSRLGTQTCHLDPSWHSGEGSGSQNAGTRLTGHSRVL